MIDYNVCRFCKWFSKGKCTNSAFENEQESISFYKFSEDGILAGAIEEGFGTIKFNDFEQALFESTLSKKKARELLDILYDELEDEKVNLVERIDESVSIALQNFDFGNGEADGVTIAADTSEFSCKNFW